jgi:hypothetical protein
VHSLSSIRQRAAVVAAASALMLAGCGPGGTGFGGGVPLGPPSAKSVAYDTNDLPGLQTCPESGSGDHYLTSEQTNNPDQYSADKPEFDAWRSAGANDIYVVVYANAASGCGVISPTTPDGKLAQVLTIRFYDASAAATSFNTFKSQAEQKGSSTTASGSVLQGSATGLGDNSVVVSIDLVITTYIAVWQNKAFEVLLFVYGLTESESSTAAAKINSRIR